MAGGALPLLNRYGNAKTGVGMKIDALTSIADIYATFASAAGCPISTVSAGGYDEDIDGQDLLPLIRGEITSVRESLVLAINYTVLSGAEEDAVSAIIDGDLKLLLGTSAVSEQHVQAGSSKQRDCRARCTWCRSAHWCGAGEARTEAG